MSFPTTRVATLLGHGGAVNALAYSKGSADYILTGSNDRTIRIFNPRAAAEGRDELVQTYKEHGYEVLDLAIAEANDRFVSVGGDKDVFHWDVYNARLIKKYSGHARRVMCCAFGGDDDSVIISGGFDGFVKLWDTKSNSHVALMTFKDAKDAVSSVEVSGHQVTSGSHDGRIRCYDIRNGKIVVDVMPASVTSITPSKDNESILVGTLDSTLRLIDKSNGCLLQTYKAPGFLNATYRSRSTLAMNGSMVLAASEDGTVFAWDLVSGEVKVKVRHPEASAIKRSKDVVSAVAWCPNDRRKEWCSAGGDGTVAVWGVKEER
ncbi:WD40 repeat-like protein [Aulographum hederae CBS 113979]|uniref:WD40 repeat-like protein n=1 Tax=Aulographum hederae CBS 113979 TaxID=1176131 RepID=A0A6G1GZZ6_9PEZI|nr:WD40 repeat-like protein [Aulographum hederae CBS 113979]